MAPFLGVWPIITAGGARAHNGGAAFVLIRDLKSLTWTIIIAVDIKVLTIIITVDIKERLVK